jgi:hypothetical protein
LIYGGEILDTDGGERLKKCPEADPFYKKGTQGILQGTQGILEKFRREAEDRCQSLVCYIRNKEVDPERSRRHCKGSGGEGLDSCSADADVAEEDANCCQWTWYL